MDDEEPIRVIAVTTDDDGVLEKAEATALQKASALAFGILKEHLGATAVGFIIIVGAELRFAMIADEALPKEDRRFAMSSALVAGPMRYKAWCRKTLGLYGYDGLTLSALGLCPCSGRPETPVAH